MFYGLAQLGCFQMPTLRLKHCPCPWVFSTQNFFMNLWHLYIYNFVLFCVYTCQSCVLNMCTSAYIYSALVLVSDTHSWNQYIVGWCSLLIIVVFILPEHLYYLQHCIDGIFNLRLPPMYAIVIIPRCFVFCMFLCKFHVLCYGLEQLDCFQMPTLRFQHWVFPSQDVFMNFWHLYIHYMFVLIQSVLFCIRGCQGCPRLNLYCVTVVVYNLLLFLC
jgi:hypothetical protein